MKQFTLILYGALMVFSALDLQLSTTFAQGSLTPPGAPAPTMKSLDQIEPRTRIATIPFVITNSGAYYLTTNLVNVSSINGITIATNNVDIDLHGFTIQGNGDFSIGIYVNSACTNVSVHDGTISRWGGPGVISEWASSQQVRFERLIVCDNGQGIALQGPGAIRDCTIFNNLSGIYCSGSATVSGCTVRQNNSWGIYVISNCVVSGNLVARNATSGIYLDSPGGNEIVGNVCSENNTSLNSGEAGIFILSSGNRIDSNRIIGGGMAGIRIFSSATFTNNVVTRNIASGNGANNFVIPANQFVGPIISTTGTITNSNPWANFSY